MRESKAAERRSGSQNCPLILMFILSEAAGVPGPQPRTAALARSHWLCGSLKDKTVMKLDGNDTKESLRPDSQTNCSSHPSAVALSHNINLLLHPCPAGCISLGPVSGRPCRYQATGRTCVCLIKQAA